MKLKKILTAFTLACLLCSQIVHSEAMYLNDVTVDYLAINGGEDSPSVGTSCVRFSSGIDLACANGWVAIKNNNSVLVSAALSAKAMKGEVWVYYDNAQPTEHCPGHINTPCVLGSLGLK
ncbi:MAG: hypothetical protein K6L76_06575 [Agarilytica sp.]